MSLKDLRSKSKQASAKLSEELSKLNKKTYENPLEGKFWKPTVDKMGNGYAVIRFLPEPEGEDVPFVRYWDHGFQGPTGKWYIEKSLTSLGKDVADPVSKLNKTLWDSGVKEMKDQASAQKRRLHFVSNILVVNDKGNPENNGKVFLYEYGKKIFDKINAAQNPEFDDEEAINPFLIDEGANFRLKIKNVDGYRNYDSSEFDSPSPISDDDDEIEKIIEQYYDKPEHKLQQFVDPKNYKSYDELEKRLNDVLGLVGKKPSTKEDEFEEEEVQEAPRKQKEAPAPEPKRQEIDEDDDDDGAMAKFKAMSFDDDDDIPF